MKSPHARSVENRCFIDGGCARSIHLPLRGRRASFTCLSLSLSFIYVYTYRIARIYTSGGEDDTDERRMREMKRGEDVESLARCLDFEKESSFRGPWRERERENSRGERRRGQVRAGAAAGRDRKSDSTERERDREKRAVCKAA